MDNLQDYSAGVQPSLQDFQSTKDDTAPLFNRPSVVAMAAKSAAFSSQPDKVVDNYQAVLNENTLNGQSATASQLVDEAKQNHFSANQGALLNLMGDPNVPDSVKQAAVNKVYDRGSDLYSTDRMLQTSALNSGVSGETAEEERVRVNTARTLDEVDNVRYQQQAMVNAEIAKLNPDAKEKALDILGTLIPFSQRRNIADLRAELTGSTVSSYAKAIFLPGEAKQDIADAIRAMPPEDRLSLVQKTIDYLNTHSGITSSSDNQLQQAAYLQQYLSEGGYDPNDRMADNVAGILDFTMLGGFSKEAKAINATNAEARFTAGAEDLANRARAWAQSNAARDTTRSGTQPLSLSQVYKDTNVDKYRNTFDLAANGPEAVSEATHNASRADAIVGDAAPTMSHGDGSVDARPIAPDANDVMRNAPSPELTEFVNFDSGNKYFQQEKAQARANIKNDFQQVQGLTSRDQMFQVEDTPAGIKVKGVYGPPVSGYSNAQEALDMAKWGFQKYGLTEDNLQLLTRQGSKYVPITKEEALKQGNTGDFLVQVDYNHTIGDGDVKDWIAPSTKFNFLDRSSGSGQRGTIVSNIFPQDSIQDPVVFKAASTATDREAGLEKILLKGQNDHAKAYLKLPEGEQDLLFKTYLTGNDARKTYSNVELKGMGFNDAMIDTYRKFRQTADDYWYLENRAMAKKLNNEGWSLYVHDASDTSLVARDMKVGEVKGGTRIYDPVANTFTPMKDTELVDLYNKGGSIAKLRQPIPYNGDMVEQVLVHNQPHQSYLRGINKDSQVLNYIPGYFPVKYKDPHFIDEIVTNSAGTPIGHKTVATAPNIKQAEAMKQRLATVTGKEYRRRYGREMNMKTSSDAHYDLAITHGRSAQRFRGKQLEDSTSNIFSLDQANIKTPIEAMVDSARSISRYTTVGDTIETMKQRILNRYADYMPQIEGRPVFPSNGKDVSYRGAKEENRSTLADAKTQVAFVNFMEHGYVNALDSGFKSILNEMADALGAKGFEGTEEKLRGVATNKTLTGRGKGLVFNLLIALNPLRQFLVQSHQAVLLTSINPGWALSGKGFNQTAFMIARQLGMKTSNMPKQLLNYFEFTTGMSARELEQMGKQYDLTGLGAAIDKHSLVSGNLSDLADRMVAKGQRGIASKITAAPRAVLTGARKVGFDMGEYINTTTSWLAHRDLAIKAGKDVNNAEVAADVAAKSRAFTGNMNRAGDMPWNETEAGIVLTYQQNAWKLLFNGMTSRIMTKDEYGMNVKARLWTTYLTLFGVGTAAAYAEWMDPIMPKDPTARNLVANGVECVAFNKLTSMAVGDKVNLDCSRIAPVDMYGTYDLIHSLFTTDAGKIAAATPVGSLFLGSNPRVATFVKTAAKYFNLVDDYSDPTTFGQVALDFAKLSSGFSNLYKAAYLYEYQKKLYSTGRTKDMNVPTVQAVAMAFGIDDADEAIKSYMQQQAIQKQQDIKSDVNKWYQQYRSRLADQQITPDELGYANKQYTEFFRAFKDKPGEQFAYMELDRLLKQDVKAGDGTFYQSVLRQSDFTDASTLKARVNALQRTDDDTKASLNRAIDYMNSFKPQEK